MSTIPSIRAGKYSKVPVNVYRPVDLPNGDIGGESATVLISLIDLLAEHIDPMPFYAERRYMETLTPTRLGAYLVLRAAYFRLPNWIAALPPIRWAWQLTRGKD